MADPMENVTDFKLSGALIVKEAYHTPTTEMISQSFGRLLIEHEVLTDMLPSYLHGCADAIIVDCLYHLHRCALFERDHDKVLNDELTKAILGEFTRIRDDMRLRRNSPQTETPCSCGKKGSCQSPIMEA